MKYRVVELMLSYLSGLFWKKYKHSIAYIPKKHIDTTLIIY